MFISFDFDISKLIIADHFPEFHILFVCLFVLSWCFSVACLYVMNVVGSKVRLKYGDRGIEYIYIFNLYMIIKTFYIRIFLL